MIKPEYPASNVFRTGRWEISFFTDSGQKKEEIEWKETKY